ncbi:MAG: hypothetical protein KGH52_04425 [Candidatus Micrarchaeota archaeon]|nr:hypothetical protein [Candidatus Micrarchaeota archaeon]
MSEIRTLCYICGKISARVCGMCGRHVCEEHFDQKANVCTSCAKGRKY